MADQSILFSQPAGELFGIQTADFGWSSVNPALVFPLQPDDFVRFQVATGSFSCSFNVPIAGNGVAFATVQIISSIDGILGSDSHPLDNNVFVPFIINISRRNIAALFEILSISISSQKAGSTVFWGAQGGSMTFDFWNSAFVPITTPQPLLPPPRIPLRFRSGPDCERKIRLGM